MDDAILALSDAKVKAAMIFLQKRRSIAVKRQPKTNHAIKNSTKTHNMASENFISVLC